MLFHAWNVGDLDQMALPPCHMVYQCHVTSQGALNMAIFQRSADAFLGLPWNQIGGSVLLLMLAEQAGLKPGELVWMGGDVHIYTRSEEHTSELQSLMRISYAVFCLKKKIKYKHL